jgi:hypothetical protein
VPALRPHLLKEAAGHTAKPDPDHPGVSTLGPAPIG